MAIDYEHLLAYSIPEAEQRITPRDCMLYALGLGLGADPLDGGQLRYVYEQDLAALPMMSAVLGTPGFWVRRPDTGVDWVKVLHGEQALTIHRPLPVDTTVVGRSRVTGIVDKGEGRGAMLYIERQVTEKETGALLCTLEQTTFCRGDGGFGGPSGPTKQPHPLPDRPADQVCELPTLPQAALIYRLSGDYNPLHADPEVAAKAGYKQPILHGLCSFGVAGHAILKTCCDYAPDQLRTMAVRFSAPVYPGETIRTEIWRDDGVISFRSSAAERDVVVLNNGRVELA